MAFHTLLIYEFADGQALLMAGFAGLSALDAGEDVFVLSCHLIFPIPTSGLPPILTAVNIYVRNVTEEDLRN